MLQSENFVSQSISAHWLKAREMTAVNLCESLYRMSLYASC